MEIDVYLCPESPAASAVQMAECLTVSPETRAAATKRATYACARCYKLKRKVIGSCNPREDIGSDQLCSATMGPQHVPAASKHMLSV